MTTRLAPAHRRPMLAPDLPSEGRAAVKGGALGNFVDQINIFLPVTALAPALPTLAGPETVASSVAFIVMATLIGRPLDAIIFGRIADAVGRTATTRMAIAGTAACTLPIVAIGDVQPDDVPALAATGVAGVAIVRAIMQADDPGAAAAAALAGWATPGRRAER